MPSLELPKFYISTLGTKSNIYRTLQNKDLSFQANQSTIKVLHVNLFELEYFVFIV